MSASVSIVVIVPLELLMMYLLIKSFIYHTLNMKNLDGSHRISHSTNGLTSEKNSTLNSFEIIILKYDSNCSDFVANTISFYNNNHYDEDV